jgi:hypothetical protein
MVMVSKPRISLDRVFDADKLRELMVYVAERSMEDPSFGATKLNKILFFSDFYAYGKYGKPITGATYQRLERGPAPRQLMPIQNELEHRGDAIVVEREHFNLRQKRLIPLRQANLAIFSAEEISLVDEVIEALRLKSAAGVSALSHEVTVGWQIAGDREEIPYEAVFLSNEEPTPTDVRRALELARQHGWLART